MASIYRQSPWLCCYRPFNSQKCNFFFSQARRPNLKICTASQENKHQVLSMPYIKRNRKGKNNACSQPSRNSLMRGTKKNSKKVCFDEKAFLWSQLNFDKHHLKQFRFLVEFATQISKGFTPTHMMLDSPAKELSST